MKSLAISIGIVIATIALLFWMFHAFGVGDKVAGPLASLFLGSITFIHDKVDKALSSGKSRVSPGIVPITSFDIRWPYMLVYATLTFVAILELADVINFFPEMFLLWLTRSLPREIGVGLAMAFAVPTVAWGIFFLGRWVGIRSAKTGYWILPLSIWLGGALDIAGAYFFVPSMRPILQANLQRSYVVKGVVFYALFLCVVGMLGVWRGNRVRFGAYFNSLLKEVSESTRTTLLAMTFEEAKAANP
jgi:hypothetical protein